MKLSSPGCRAPCCVPATAATTPNGPASRLPSSTAQPSPWGAIGPADVRSAVEFAGANELPLAVQSTGHGLSVPLNGGVLISTRRMDGVHINAGAHTARLEAGVRWEQVIAKAASHGLAPLSGSAPHVGAISYTLGGGLGLLARGYGYAADHVRGIDVVTADARLRHVTAESDPDLFWALRGGRYNFGVVTGMEIDLVPLRRLYGGGLYFDAELTADFVRTYQQWADTVPEEVTTSFSVIAMPDIPVIAEAIRGRRIVHFRMAYTGDADSGERMLAPLRAVGPRLIDTVREMPFTDAGSIYNDPTFAHGYYGTNVMLRELDVPAVLTVLDAAGPDAAAPCIVDVRQLGGAMARPPAVPNAVGHRRARFLLRVLTPLSNADTGTARLVQRRLLETVAPWTMGQCPNFMYGEDTTTEQVRGFYEPADYERLTRLKAVYDPTNLFRLHHNIAPTIRRDDLTHDRSSHE